MKEVTGQNLGMFWTKVCRTVLGEVNDLQTANKAEDKVCKINCMVYIIYTTTHERERWEIMLKGRMCHVCAHLLNKLFQITHYLTASWALTGLLKQ